MHRVRRFFPALISLAMLTALLLYVVGNREKLADLLNVSFSSVLMMVALTVVSTVLGGTINFLIYPVLGASLRFTEAVSLAAVNSLANLLPLAGGLIVKASYLKHRHQLSYTDFLSSMLAVFVLFLTVNGLSGLLSLAFIALSTDMRASWLLPVAFLGLTAAIAVFWLPIHFLPIPASWRQRLEPIARGLQVLSGQRGLIRKLIVVQLLLVVVFAGRFWIGFHMLSQPLSAAQAVLVSAGTILTQLVNISPGGLGIREGIVGGIASLLGFDLGVSVVAVTIDRLISTAITIALGSLASYYLARRLGASPVVEVEREGSG